MALIKHLLCVMNGIFFHLEVEIYISGKGTGVRGSAVRNRDAVNALPMMTSLCLHCCL